MRDESGRTPLMCACRDGYTECARLLLQAGADPNAEDTDGWTALMYACLNGHETCARLLIQAGADINATVGERRPRSRWPCKRGMQAACACCAPQGLTSEHIHPL